MSNEKKTVSLSTVDRIVKEHDNNTAEIEWYGETLEIKRALNLADMLTLTDLVVKNCFTEDGKYMPETRDFVLRCGVLELYAGFELPEEIGQRYETVYSDPMCDAFSKTLDSINWFQYGEIRDAIDNKIDYIVNTDIDLVNREIHKMTDAVEALGEEFAGVFGRLSDDETQALVQSLVHGVDEGKIMDAYMAAKEPKAEEAEAEEHGE